MKRGSSTTNAFPSNVYKILKSQDKGKASENYKRNMVFF